MKACILKHHLLPVFGHMPLDAIRMHPIDVLKASLRAKGLSRKRVNNIVACLGKMLRYAHEVELIEAVPRVKLSKIPPQEFDFLTRSVAVAARSRSRCSASKADCKWAARVGMRAALTEGERQRSLPAAEGRPFAACPPCRSRAPFGVPRRAPLLNDKGVSDEALCTAPALRVRR